MDGEETVETEALYLSLNFLFITSTLLSGSHGSHMARVLHRELGPLVVFDLVGVGLLSQGSS